MSSRSASDGCERSGGNVYYLDCVWLGTRSLALRDVFGLVQIFQAELLHHAGNAAASVVVAGDEPGGSPLDGFDGCHASFY